MSEYTFVIEATISMSVCVKADSLEEAVDAAQSLPVMSLCHQCSRGKKDEWSTSGELDFDPNSCVLLEVICDEDYLDIAVAREVW